jgi:hypothetical protein
MYGTRWLDHFQPPVGTGKGCQACRQATEEACEREKQKGKRRGLSVWAFSRET